MDTYRGSEGPASNDMKSVVVQLFQEVHDLKASVNEIKENVQLVLSIVKQGGYKDSELKPTPKRPPDGLTAVKLAGAQRQSPYVEMASFKQTKQKQTPDDSITAVKHTGFAMQEPVQSGPRELPMQSPAQSNQRNMPGGPPLPSNQGMTHPPSMATAPMDGPWNGHVDLIITDDTDSDSETESETESEPEEEEPPIVSLAKPNAKKANFGKSLPPPRPASPAPTSSEQISVPSSAFKRSKTDFFEDNRHHYFSGRIKVTNLGDHSTVLQVPQIEHSNSISRGIDGNLPVSKGEQMPTAGSSGVSMNKATGSSVNTPVETHISKVDSGASTLHSAPNTQTFDPAVTGATVPAMGRSLPGRDTVPMVINNIPTTEILPTGKSIPARDSVRTQQTVVNGMTNVPADSGRATSPVLDSARNTNSQQNNRMMYDSWLRNDHGNDDNRNDIAAHDDEEDEGPQLVSRRREALSNFGLLAQQQTSSGSNNPAYVPVTVNGTDADTRQQAGTSDITRQPVEEPEQNLPNGEEEEEVEETEVVDIHQLVDQQRLDAKSCQDVKSQGVDTVICLDTSASMSATLPMAKKRILEFIDGIDNNVVEFELEENIALVTFGSSNRIVQHLTNDYDCVRDALETVTADGPSPLSLGLTLALVELEQRGGACTWSNHKAMPRIILISDGFATNGGNLTGQDSTLVNKEADALAASIVETNSSSLDSISCVFLLNFNKESLQTIASRSGGKLIAASKLNTLCSYFRIHTIVSEMLQEMKGQDELGTEETLKRSVGQKYQHLDPDDIAEVVGILSREWDKTRKKEVPIPIGGRVQVTSLWSGDDGRRDMTGSVISLLKKGSVKVMWDDGVETKCRYGADDSYDIVEVNRPRLLQPEESIGIGIKVERGQHWRWKDQDGGPGSVGVVTKMEKTNVVHVVWQNGGLGNYRFGYNKKFDIRVCDGQQQPTASADGKQPCWQYERTEGTWVSFPPDASDSIESVYQTKPEGTAFITVGEESFRVLLDSWQARNLTQTSTGLVSVRRIELTEEERQRLSADE